MRVLLVVVVVVAVAACASHAVPTPEVLVGAPCEGCELVFLDQPASPGPRARIAPPGEPGEPLAIDGVVRDATGAPVGGVIVYAYHTDAGGRYPPGATPHGRLRGFARTGADGRYHFDTIRPGAYPGGDVPQHVHMHVIEPGRCTYYLAELWFTDDPLITDAHRAEAAREARGGNGLVTPVHEAGGWLVRRDLTLGEGIADYARCGG